MPRGRPDSYVCFHEEKPKGVRHAQSPLWIKKKYLQIFHSGGLSGLFFFVIISQCETVSRLMNPTVDFLI
jgi:hypothetical protein